MAKSSSKRVKKIQTSRLNLKNALLVLAFALVGSILVATTFAAKGKPSSGSSTVSVVMLQDVNSNGLPNWGDTITFNVATTATEKPFVALTCDQNGSQVFSKSAGFWEGYPFTTSFKLSSTHWTSGAADCKAQLYYQRTNGRTTILKTLDFHVDA